MFNSFPRTCKESLKCSKFSYSFDCLQVYQYMNEKTLLECGSNKLRFLFSKKVTLSRTTRSLTFTALLIRLY